MPLFGTPWWLNFGVSKFYPLALAVQPFSKWQCACSSASSRPPTSHIWSSFWWELYHRRMHKTRIWGVRNKLENAQIYVTASREECWQDPAHPRCAQPPPEIKSSFPRGPLTLWYIFSCFALYFNHLCTILSSFISPVLELYIYGIVVYVILGLASLLSICEIHHVVWSYSVLSLLDGIPLYDYNFITSTAV